MLRRYFCLIIRNYIIMKKITLIIASFIAAAMISTVYADNTGNEPPKTVNISGAVVDKTNQEALAGALVKIEGTDIEVYTDLDGKFTISGIVPDTYKIKCSMISYIETEEEIVIRQKSEKLEIQLQNLSAE